jgi:mono/diheme cytochrome c family protein
MRLRWNPVSRWALVALVLCAPSAPELLAQEGEGAPDRLVRGRRSFQVHCVNCHGDEGRGDGPLAEILRVPPRDLTQLSRNNGGEFPTDRIYQAIDGRSEIVGHGRREMPVWGLTFLERGRDTAEEKATQERIIDLIFYLRMIQASPPEKTPREPR